MQVFIFVPLEYLYLVGGSICIGSYWNVHTPLAEDWEMARGDDGMLSTKQIQEIFMDKSKVKSTKNKR